MTTINVDDYVTFAGYDHGDGKGNDGVERTLRVDIVSTDYLRGYRPRNADYRTYVKSRMGRILNVTRGDSMTPAEYAMLIPS